MSLPGVAAVMTAIRERVGNPKAALWGEPARELERICADHTQADLVEAVTWAADGWGPPLIVAQLPELVADVQARVATPEVDELTMRRRAVEAARDRGEEWAQDYEVPTELEENQALEQLVRLQNLATQRAEVGE